MIALLDGWQSADFARLPIYCAICIFCMCFLMGCVVTANSSMKIRDGLLIGCFGESGLIPFGAIWVLAGLLMGFGITDNGVQGRDRAIQTEINARIANLRNFSDEAEDFGYHGLTDGKPARSVVNNGTNYATVLYLKASCKSPNQLLGIIFVSDEDIITAQPSTIDEQFVPNGKWSAGFFETFPELADCARRAIHILNTPSHS